jgi:hypothetical protein
MLAHSAPDGEAVVAETRRRLQLPPEHAEKQALTGL